MKTIIIILLFFGMNTTLVRAQWEFQNPVPTNATLNDIFFIDVNHGWAVGDYGTVLYTVDGGNNWIEQHSDKNTPAGQYTEFYNIHFSDPNHGGTVGKYLLNAEEEYGVIYRTSDGGYTWQEKYVKINEVIKDVWFVNQDTGWAVGYNEFEETGIILCTKDGSNTWEEQYNGNDVTLNGISFADINNGWVVGNNGIILHTNDCGETWTEQESNVSVNFLSVSFTDLDKGWITGDMDSFPHQSKILHTDDGGETWEVNYETGEYIYVKDIFFVDNNNGWVACDFRHASIQSSGLLLTNDGGITWTHQYYLGIILDQISAVFFLDTITGWATGENVIINSTDGGNSWVPKNSLSNTNFVDVCFVGQEYGWALGSKFEWAGSSSFFEGTILHTNNGGESWQEIFKDLMMGISFNSMFFTDLYRGWVVGDFLPGIMKTTDGGFSWTLVNGQFNVTPNSVFFSDSLKGWVATGVSNPWENRYGAIYNSYDGGISWSEQYNAGNTSSINSLFFIDNSDGWAVGRDTALRGLILHTSNGGSLWEEQLSGIYEQLYSVTFINSYTGWVVGDSGTILSTLDGGQNWILQDCPSEYLHYSFKSISFPDGAKGWISGIYDDQYPHLASGSVLLQTENGGETWQEQFSRPFSGLCSIQFTDPQNGYAVGYGGVILQTNNGGATGREKIIDPFTDISLVVYPNPTCGISDIRYQISDVRYVTLGVYDIHGQGVGMLVDEMQGPGHYLIRFNGTRLSAGVYSIRLKAGSATQCRKLILL